MRKKWGRLFGIFMGFVLILYGLGRFVFPLEVNDVITRAALWKGGVRSFSSEGMTGFVQNYCDPADPEARGCSCIALIHGLGDTPDTWKKLLLAPPSAWKKPVRIYALDVAHASHFVEGDAATLYSVHNQAHQISKALKPLCSGFLVLGNSLGGWIATWMALDHELPIQKLILSSSVGLAPHEGDRMADVTSLFSHLDAARIKEFQKRAYYHPHEYPDSILQKAAEKLNQAHLEKIIQAQMKEDLLDDQLKNLNIPTLVVWGTADHLVPISQGLIFKSKIPGVQFKELTDCGHIPQKECPKELIGAINQMLLFGGM